MNSRPPFFSALRFCGSCAVTLVYWAVWLVLSATLAALIYIAVAKELPVPDFVLRRAEAKLAAANLSIKFGRARFDPTGRILLENVQLRSNQFEEPLLTSRLVFTQRSLWSILAGRPVPDEIRLEGATLQLPAMISPSGTAEPLVKDLAARLRHEGHTWSVDQLSGRIGPLLVTVRGDFTTPPRSAEATPPSVEALVAQFLQVGRRLILELHQFDAFEEPSLSVRLESTASVGNTAKLLFTAKAARQPWGQPLSVGPLVAATTLRLDGPGERTARLYLATRDASFRDKFYAENVRAVITVRTQPDKFIVRPIDATLAAGAIFAEQERLLGPVVRAELANWPKITATLATQIRGDVITAEVETHLREQSAHLHAAGRVSPELISSVLEKHTPRAAPYFVFGDPVVFDAEATLGPGWHFERLSSRTESGRIDSRGVKITSTRGRIDIVGTSFLAHDAEVVMGENQARGSYWMDFATTDYRMLLTGRLRPPEINGWFNGNWWLTFWNDHFAFPTTPPEGDVDLQGRWRDATRTEYFGRGDAVGPVILRETFERVHTLIFLRPSYTEAIELNGQRAGGRQLIAGTFRRLADATSRETNRLEFNLTSNLETETYHRMFPGKADELLGSMQLNQPPKVHAEGVIEGRWPGATPHYTFAGHAEGGLHYYGFPVETAQVSGGVTGNDVKLDEIQFALAGGKGKGKASLTGSPERRVLGFDLEINGADLARAIRAVEEYQANRTGQKSASVTESKFMKRASGGRLNVALSAQGRPGDLPSFKGLGSAALTGTELGEIQLFGLLSQVLSGLALNFSSLKLDAARTSFRMDGGRLWFPDLRISGPSAVIDARGDFTFATNALDFTAKFKPFEEKHNLLTVTLGIVINPITSILELRLTGPLSNPEWSIAVGPSSARPETIAPAEPAIIPAAPPVK